MRLGIIGYGYRISLFLKELLKINPNCQIAAIADLNVEGVKEKLASAGHPLPHFYTSADAMLNSEQLDGILIGTRCSTHTEMALKVLQRKIPLFLEKPVSTTLQDWERLHTAARNNPTPVVVSFPLRFTPIVQLAKEIVESGKIGTVEHVQAINNVPYGGVYYHEWYRDEKETGGLFLQKATHDLDYIQSILRGTPSNVCAIKSKQLFMGNKPDGLRCSACDETDCPERVEISTRFQIPIDHCCFSGSTGNEDAGTAIIQYQSGMHVSYSQNFMVRRNAQARGGRFIGYKGTLEFDFYKNKLQVYMHHTSRVETHNLEVKGPHFGGDPILAKNFINVVNGTEATRSTLLDGLLSALICLKAREAAETKLYQSINWDSEKESTVHVGIFN
ncbi:gfo/Idh/MocA family oxidoreductase [Paenibacillus sp. LMG 31460]|uniref:Gfo/Idh/MocA family oxidoreductase n=1 Tax=Paenibacillus germinis TaxID=2654979 RepID=A0ABX1YWK1_9BACL|nr:Gfo/Idh/MocA family oxidoreductase [Paenibacillus germinis]NOU85331.1 gfo/Idh/MocA family oxidoreductase [Paenibacillus germinis]